MASNLVASLLLLAMASTLLAIASNNLSLTQSLGPTVVNILRGPSNLQRNGLHFGGQSPKHEQDNHLGLCPQITIVQCSGDY